MTGDGGDWIQANVAPIEGQMSPSVVVGGNTPTASSDKKISCSCDTPPNAEAKSWPDPAESMQIARIGTLLLGLPSGAVIGSKPQ